MTDFTYRQGFDPEHRRLLRSCRERQQTGGQRNGIQWRYVFLAVGILGLIFLLSCQEAHAEVYDVDQIADAIYRIEGGTKAKKPYGILSVPCDGEEDCRRICLNTIENNFMRWQAAGSQGDFLAFLAQKYAPLEAHPLNKNWLPNLRKVLGGV